MNALSVCKQSVVQVVCKQSVAQVVYKQSVVQVVYKQSAARVLASVHVLFSEYYAYKPGVEAYKILHAQLKFGQMINNRLN